MAPLFELIPADCDPRLLPALPRLKVTPGVIRGDVIDLLDPLFRPSVFWVYALALIGTLLEESWLAGSR